MPPGAAEVGDGGVVVGQLLLIAAPCGIGLRLRQLARRDSTPAEVVVVARQLLRKPVTAGLSSASFCRIARPCGVRPPPPPACRLKQDGDADDRARQVAAGVVRGPGSVGQRLLVARASL